VVRPISELSVPNFDDQVLYVPDILKIQKIFEQGGYDQIICSTEMLMGGVALYLKHAFSIPAHFFMHTDWLAFAEQRIQPNPALNDRLRRMLRGFYQAFDGVVTLNQEHQEMLMGPEFDLPDSKVLRSAHWPAEIFTQARELTPISQRPKRIIYTGRLSPEKGVGDLPKIWQRIVAAHPDAQLVLAGTGPMEAELKSAMPEAKFTGWLSHEQLIDNYGQSRCQILPSRFDTFGCVVTEAMSLGVPTFAYDCKGPASIIEDHKTGRLANTADQLADAICEFLEDDQYQSNMSSNALKSALRWRDSEILNSLLSDIYTNS
jgi:glycosyltransferase involved in cell wall biosynthesis